MKTKVKLFRFDPSKDATPRYELYEVPYEKGDRVLDVLRYIHEELGVDVAFRYACRSRFCGTCGVLVNGKPILACWEEVLPKMVIEPLPNFPIIKDLVIDRSFYDEKIQKVYPNIISDEQRFDNITFENFPKLEPKKMNDVIYSQQCLGCLLCVAACRTTHSDPKFLGPASLMAAYRVCADPRDEGRDLRLDIIDDKKGCWHCHYVFSCVDVCPMGLSPPLAISKLRMMILLKKIKKIKDLLRR
ncbi:MAG: succinate dehydrogenase/fumarate reductase iron-sulfur subunit [Nitrososphaerota archaeon]|nr:succinate dehydrogenase/fumarate reductase iron-sulfur subunit [Nitrososphaerota archaeon]